MPCKVNVYVKEGQVYLCTMPPRLIAQFFPRAGLESLAAEVDGIVREIIDESK